MKKIIFTSGAWDMLHAGHLNILKQAKKMGDYLIVGVSTDELIASYKGMPPIVCYEDRVALIKELRCVDKVVKQTKLVDIEQFKKLKADLFVLGDDWKYKCNNEGINWLRDNGKVRWIPYTKRLSTSKIKETIISQADKITENLNKRNQNVR